MKAKNLTINEMIAQIITEARNLGYCEATIWRHITPRLRTIAVYYEKRGVCFYNPVITRELVDLQKERLDREEISIHYYKRVKSAANRLDEFYLTGTLRPFLVGVFGITEGTFQSDHIFQIVGKPTDKLTTHPITPLSSGMPLKSRAHSFKLPVSRDRYCRADFGSSCPRICAIVVSGVPVTSSFLASRRRSP